MLTYFRWNNLGIAALESSADTFEPNAALSEILGKLWEAEGNQQKATARYRIAIAADPSYWPVYYRLGTQSLRNGQTHEAEQYLRLALKHQPDSLPILLRLARVFERTGNDAEAIKSYRKINELQPNLAPVMNNLAWLLSKKPETLDEALGYARLAVDAQPSRAEVRDTLGWIFFQKGDYSSAREHLDKAAFFNSVNPSILFHRGMAYYKLGDRERALADFKKADSASFPFPERQLTQNMIQELS